MNAPLAKVATAIFDTTRAPEWVEDLEKATLVRWVSGTEYIEYDHINTPFVMKDRDFVSSVKILIEKPAQDSPVLKFVYHSAEDPARPPTRFVRGNLMSTTFILTSLENDTKTHVIGEVHADPMGSVPKWIVNFFQKDWPIDTLQGLRKQVAKADVKTDPRFTALLTAATENQAVPVPVSATPYRASPKTKSQ
ncbi:MAG: hypothetical protein HY074_08760 [Deltaproteobacteria bacterium]|nr:hypothetical protein [Deltaproteobacteria bacterium]